MRQTGCVLAALILAALSGCCNTSWRPLGGLFCGPPMCCQPCGGGYGVPTAYGYQPGYGYQTPAPTFGATTPAGGSTYAPIAASSGSSIPGPVSSSTTGYVTPASYTTQQAYLPTQPPCQCQ